jgi:hypothetical protein
MSEKTESKTDEKKTGINAKKNGRFQMQAAQKYVKFEGKTDDLKGHIYDCSDARQSDQFTKTTKEIAEYLGRTAYKHGGDIRLTVTNLELYVIPMPQDLPTTPEPSALTKKIWDEQVKRYVERDSYLTDNVKTLFAIVIGQCTEVMIAKLEALPNYDDIVEDGDGVELLKMIKNLTFNF